MTRYHANQPRRDGFTLVEIMVVILIIGILVALVTTQVMRFTDTTVTETTVEIRQIAIGVESFKFRFGVYPPSRITLSNTAASMDAESTAYVNRIWPRLNMSTSGFDWAGGGPWPTSGAVTLEGDQCLVYFLRGPTGAGWSTNPQNPTATGGTRAGPFFEFPLSRLVWIPHAGTSQTDATWFWSFADPSSTSARMNVYAFFSSRMRANGYEVASDGTALPSCPSLGPPFAPGPSNIFGAGNLTSTAYAASTSQPTGITPTSPTATVSAYTQSATGRYYNANSFQIISAGANQTFGIGGAWTAGTGTEYDNELARGYDDLSNFNSGVLGVP